MKVEEGTLLWIGEQVVGYVPGGHCEANWLLLFGFPAVGGKKALLA
jgi:hypothetical protein